MARDAEPSADALSTMRGRTPSRASSSAVTRPVGPAPAINTGTVIRAASARIVRQLGQWESRRAADRTALTSSPESRLCTWERLELPMYPDGRAEMRRMRIGVLVLLLVSAMSMRAFGQQPASSAGEPSVPLPPELARVLDDYATAWAARDPAALARLFAE